jgi:hypothetical protein
MKPVVFASGDISTFYKCGAALLGYSILESEECDNFVSVVVHKDVESDTLYLRVIHSMSQDRAYWEDMEGCTVILVDSEPLRRFYATLFPSKQVHCVQDIFDDIREIPGEEDFAGLGDLENIQEHCMAMATTIGSNFFTNSFYFVCLLEYDHHDRGSRNLSFQKEELRKACCKCSKTWSLKRRRAMTNMDKNEESADEMEAQFRSAIGVWHATRISNILASVESVLGKTAVAPTEVRQPPTTTGADDNHEVPGSSGEPKVEVDGDQEVPGPSGVPYWMYSLPE